MAVSWHGSHAVTLTYRDGNGRVTERLVFRTDEPSLSLAAAAARWTFDADGGLFRLVSEVRPIQLAHLFEPKLAVHLSVLEPLPHQIEAVYGEMIPRLPLRFALCDDPDAGSVMKNRAAALTGQQSLRNRAVPRLRGDRVDGLGTPAGPIS